MECLENVTIWKCKGLDFVDVWGELAKQERENREE